jgi:hypothetical protein
MEVMELSEPNAASTARPQGNYRKTAVMRMNSGYRTFIVEYARLTKKERLVLDR